MKKQTFLIRDDLGKAFLELGIHEGSVVCVQASDDFCRQVIGQAQTIIDVLMKCIGKTGCLFTPSFSFLTLDPASDPCKIDYEQWKLIRENQLGYSSILTGCDDQGLFANQFLKNDNVVRTMHPVYSFAFWGQYTEKDLQQKQNYPLSFTHVLSSFANRQAFNLLLGIKPEDSVLLPAVAKTLNQGITRLERALVKKGSANVVKTYLVIDQQELNKEKLIKYCYQKECEILKHKIYRLSLDETTDSE